MTIETKNEAGRLLPIEKYLTTGSHIGTAFKTHHMMPYVFKKRKDGLYVLDVETIDKRLQEAARFLGQFQLSKIAVVSRRLYGQTAANKFAEILNAKALTGRFIPGTFTNPRQKRFMEPSVVLVLDPDSDSQAVLEASSAGIPIVALATTNNSLKHIDLAIPINNKGRKSLALVLWVLTRELLKSNGHIKSDADFSTPLERFEHKVPNSRDSEGEEEAVREAIMESRRIRSKGKKRAAPREHRERFSSPPSR
ncbi:MAG: 30S ribosomal protein S2 [Candidatus Micrarchaeota archaeon]